jgi:hypothetical protein
MAVPNLRQWQNGEIFNARDYVYERNVLIAEINRLEGLFTGNSNLAVSNVSANSITMGGETITSFAETGSKTFLSSTQPSTLRDGDLWFDTSE